MSWHGAGGVLGRPEHPAEQQKRYSAPGGEQENKKILVDEDGGFCIWEQGTCGYRQLLSDFMTITD